MGGFILGVINAAIVGAILIFGGLLILMLAKWAGFPIDAQVQKWYVIIVVLIVVYHIVAALFGATTWPAWRVFR